MHKGLSRHIPLGRIPRSRISGPNRNRLHAHSFEGNKTSPFADEEIETPKNPVTSPGCTRAQMAKEGSALSFIQFQKPSFSMYSTVHLISYNFNVGGGWGEQVDALRIKPMS